MPKEARWSHLKDNARQPRIGEIVDEAMVAIERDNSSLEGVLPKEYARPGQGKQRLGQLIDLVINIRFGGRENQATDILGRDYEYFLSQFASAEGRKGGQFYTPSRVVRILIEMLAPYEGRVFDPCCGSGGMFVQSARFIEAHAHSRDLLSSEHHRPEGQRDLPGNPGSRSPTQSSAVRTDNPGRVRHSGRLVGH